MQSLLCMSPPSSPARPEALLLSHELLTLPPGAFTFCTRSPEYVTAGSFISWKLFLRDCIQSAGVADYSSLSFHKEAHPDTVWSSPLAGLCLHDVRALPIPSSHSTFLTQSVLLLLPFPFARYPRCRFGHGYLVLRSLSIPFRPHSVLPSEASPL